MQIQKVESSIKVLINDSFFPECIKFYADETFSIAYNKTQNIPKDYIDSIGHYTLYTLLQFIIHFIQFWTFA